MKNEWHVWEQGAAPLCVEVSVAATHDMAAVVVVKCMTVYHTPVIIFGFWISPPGVVFYTVRVWYIRYPR